MVDEAGCAPDARFVDPSENLARVVDFSGASAGPLKMPASAGEHVRPGGRIMPPAHAGIPIGIRKGLHCSSKKNQKKKFWAHFFSIVWLSHWI